MDIRSIEHGAAKQTDRQTFFIRACLSGSLGTGILYSILLTEWGMHVRMYMCLKQLGN